VDEKVGALSSTKFYSYLSWTSMFFDKSHSRILRLFNDMDPSKGIVKRQHGTQVRRQDTKLALNGSSLPGDISCKIKYINANLIQNLKTISQLTTPRYIQLRNIVVLLLPPNITASRQ
jgi:hypothetical protein